MPEVFGNCPARDAENAKRANRFRWETRLCTLPLLLDAEKKKQGQRVPRNHDRAGGHNRVWVIKSGATLSKTGLEGQVENGDENEIQGKRIDNGAQHNVSIKAKGFWY
jgi:hypothetical protein